MPLLSVSQISQYKSRESEETFGDSEATEFTAGSHVCQFEYIFLMYDLDLHNWLKCNIADNCSVKIALSKLLKAPHVRISNHKLNWEVNRMVHNDGILSNILDYVCDTIAYCRKWLK